MRNALHRHWSSIPAGIVLSVILIAFWFVNRGYLTRGPGSGMSFLENPLPAFGLMIFGAFVAASIAGEFAIKAPLTIEPFIFAFLGGVVAGAGSVIAGMSVYSVVLFNLAGVFTLPAFMITKGWLYLAFMIAGGAVGSRALLSTTVRLGRLNREISVPGWMMDRRSRLAYFGVAAVFVIAVTAVVVLPSASTERGPALLSMGLMVLLGFAAERGTICMSSMLKELFLSHSAYVWRSVLFTIMCLALLYQAGIQLRLFDTISADQMVSAPILLAAGSFAMGIGFVFADGCFIGSLWKAGQGNVVNVAGLVGLVVGIGGMQVFTRYIAIRVSSSGIPNQLASVTNSWILVAVLWILGVSVLLLFKQKKYRF